MIFGRHSSELPPPPTVGGSPSISGGHAAPCSGVGVAVGCALTAFAARKCWPKSSPDAATSAPNALAPLSIVRRLIRVRVILDLPVWHRVEVRQRRLTRARYRQPIVPQNTETVPRCHPSAFALLY